MTKGTQMTTGNRIRDFRARKLWTQEELARRAKVSTWTVQRAETGKLRPHVMTQEKIARAFGVPRDLVFPEEREGGVLMKRPPSIYRPEDPAPPPPDFGRGPWVAAAGDLLHFARTEFRTYCGRPVLGHFETPPAWAKDLCRPCKRSVRIRRERGVA